MDKIEIVEVIKGLEEKGFFQGLEVVVKTTPTPFDDIGLKLLLMGWQVFKEIDAKKAEEDAEKEQPVSDK